MGFVASVPFDEQCNTLLESTACTLPPVSPFTVAPITRHVMMMNTWPAWMAGETAEGVLEHAGEVDRRRVAAEGRKG